jgi:hypothetical protein
MRQGTTPTHTFTLPFDTSLVSKIRVIYAQRDIVKVVKTEAEAELIGNQIVVKLTQAETLRLNHRLKTDIQLRVVTHDDEALASDIITVVTDRCLSNEVL